MTSTCNRLFVYGSLLDPGIRARLLGRPISAVAAVLPDFARRRGRYWYVSAALGRRVDGFILENLEARDFTILDDYEECPELYVREITMVTGGEGVQIQCWIYLPTHATQL